jgi:hypothetical protein
MTNVRDFYAGIETTEDHFPKLDLLPGRETCPHCNEILIYDVPDSKNEEDLVKKEYSIQM